MEEELFDFGVDIGIDNSQDSSLDENELDKIIIEAKLTNTKIRTSWGIVNLKNEH